MKNQDLVNPEAELGGALISVASHDAPQPPATLYSTLRQTFAGQLQEQGKSAQVVRNYQTALNRFQEFLGKNDDTVIGTELRSAFDAAVQRHLDDMLARGSKAATLRDRVSLLQRWKMALEVLDFQDSLPTDFAACLRHLVQKSGVSIAALTRAIDRSHKHLSTWIKGEKAPGIRSLPALEALEKFFGVAPDTLVSRTTLKHRQRLAASKRPARAIPYRERCRTATRFRYRLTEGTPVLRAEWGEYVRFKTAEILPDGMERYASWRIKPTHRASKRSRWYDTVDGGMCPTAGLVWDSLCSFLGYLALPDDPTIEADKRGLGFDKDALSLAWVTDAAFVEQYVAWRKLRSGGTLNNGALHLVVSIKSLLNPRTGFLYQRPDLAEKLPESVWGRIRRLHGHEATDPAGLWHAWCKANFKRLRKIYTHLRRARSIKKSRDSREPIQEILDGAQPILHLRRLIANMEAAFPMRCTRVRWLEHARDVLLVKMLTAHPLRAHNYSVMTYRPDNSGNLRKIDGIWKLKIPPEDFKNERGAAEELYEVEVAEGLWEDIERYVAEVRPHLYKPSMGDYLFRPFDVADDSAKITEEGAWSAAAITVRLLTITRRYLPGSPGFCAHAFRHIVATDLLKQPETRGDFVTVAKVLHDEIETVLAEYGHVTAGDGARVYNAYLAKVFDW